VPTARRRFGDAGEAVALRALEARGARVVARNVRTRYGEIDIVARDKDGWLCVEVKTRRAGSFVAAAEAMDARKLARLRGLALAWVAGRGGGRIRLALAAVTVGERGASVDLVDIAD
jgi:putative endonuclease